MVSMISPQAEKNVTLADAVLEEETDKGIVVPRVRKSSLSLTHTWNMHFAGVIRAAMPFR
jgi:hypothetical protein